MKMGQDLRDESATDGGRAAAGVRSSISRRQRNLAPRPVWQASDLGTLASLAGLLVPSWVLRQEIWPLFCRGLARIPGVVEKSLLDKTARAIQSAAVEPDARRAMTVAYDLQGAVYELRMQNLRAWRPGGWSPKIKVEGAAHLDAALAQGRGAILWVGHFAFNSNTTKMALHRLGHRILHLSRPEHGFSKTRFGIAILNPVRCIPEDRWLAQRVVFDRRAPAAAMRKLVQALRAGKPVSITAGNWEGSDLAEGELCGGRIAVATGAARLAAATGAALLPVFSVRDPKLGFRVVIEAPIELQRTGEIDALSGAAVAEFLRRHEPWVRGFPDQWRGWKEWRKA